MESKKIFIEVVREGENQEKIWVDWTKNFGTLVEVVAALQVAIGTVAAEEQKHVQLNKRFNGAIDRPDFVQRRN